MADPQFNLLPDDREVTPDQDLQAAVAGALALPAGAVPVDDPPPVPLGRSWRFNWETGQMIRAGASPAETHGIGAVIEWCQMTIHSARYAHAVFSDEFGMENPDEPLGDFAVGEILADWTRHLEEALLVHDRITAVENIDLEFDPSTGFLTINAIDIVTDDEEATTLTDLTVDRRLA